MNSSNIDNFTQNKYNYEMALKNNGYMAKLVYKSRDETADLCNGGIIVQGKFYGFTPPYDMAIANKIGKEFFRLLKKTLSSIWQPIQNIY